ncbi:MAG: hypothetical protein V3U75_13485 [Methylococcaceae bacterium]
MMKSDMTAQQFVDTTLALYGGHGWQARFAREVGVSVQTPSNWAHGRHPVPQIIVAYLELKAKVTKVEKEKDKRQLELFDIEDNVV